MGVFVLPIVITKVIFVFRDAVTAEFIISGGTVAFIGILYSWRNARFLAKYTKLVTLANIYVSSTPLLRILLFFRVNSAIVVTIWLSKVVLFVILDAY